jgi:hypothetical protein
MNKKKGDLPKVFPFVQPNNPSPHRVDPPDPPPTFTPARKVSERGMLSNVTMLLAVGVLSVALIGGGKLVLDIFGEGLFKSLHMVWAKAIVIALAYSFGWLVANLSIRVYNNLVLPLFIRFLTWACLLGVTLLYLAVIQRLYRQAYDLQHFMAYLLITSAGLGALVGLHLILEEHDLRPYSIPLLLVAFLQLATIVYRYVFTADAKPLYLLGDLLFFGIMLVFSSLMLAHLGLLNPIRQKITRFFDRNSKVIRPSQ